MQFLITAYDGTDSDSLSRRMDVRPRHLENIQKVMQTNQILCAGAITNEEGSPVGSFLIMDFPSREALDLYLESEPYVTHQVWQNIKIETCTSAILNSKLNA